MYFDKEKMFIAMYPADAIYKLTVAYLLKKEYDIEDQNAAFSFPCAASKDDLLVKLINHLCRKCSKDDEHNSLTNRICIGRLIFFLIQRDTDVTPEELQSITQKFDEMQSTSTPDKFEFTVLSFDKKDPRYTLTRILGEMMLIKTGMESPKRRGSIVDRISGKGSQLLNAARDASPLKPVTRTRRDSVANPSSSLAPPPSPTLPSSSTSGSVQLAKSSRQTSPPALSNPHEQTDNEKAPLLYKPPAKRLNQSSPPKAPQGHGAFFREVANDSKDTVQLYRPSELKTKHTAFTTSYEKRRDIMTIWCASEQLSLLLERKLNNHITATRFNDSKNIIQFFYNDLILQNVDLNMILPIAFRGLPEAIKESAKGDMLQQTHSVKKEPALIINGDNPDNSEKKSRCCGWLPCC